jgi:hypothetical protein
MRDDFGVVDCCDDRPYQKDATQHGEPRSHACRERSNEQSERRHGDQPGPERHASL